MRSASGNLRNPQGENSRPRNATTESARPVFHEIGNKDDEAIVLNGLGYVSRETGDWQKSLEYYQRARTIFAGVQDLPGEIEAITGIGKALTAMKNYHALLPLYLAELRLARQTGDPVLGGRVSGRTWQVPYEAEKRYAKAETFYRRSLEAYRCRGSSLWRGPHSDSAWAISRPIRNSILKPSPHSNRPTHSGRRRVRLRTSPRYSTSLPLFIAG